MDNDFVGQIVKDLNLDMNNDDINDLLNQVNKSEEQKKKEEEDKKWTWKQSVAYKQIHNS